MSFPIGVKFDSPVKSRSVVRTIVYPEKSNGVVASLTKSESLFSPATSLTEMNVVLLSTFLLLYCNSLVPPSLTTTFTLLISTEFDKESSLKTKLLLLISNEFKKSKS